MKRVSITEMKSLFGKELSDIYPAVEVQHFFYMALEKRLAWSRMDLMLKGDQLLNESDTDWFTNIIRGLQQQEPIQYLLGEAYFYDLMFQVGPEVLIPRPETEELVDWIVKDYQQQKAIRFMDIGTGSACIPVSIFRTLECEKAYAVDVSPEALQLAQKNADTHQASITFLEKDILTASATSLPTDLDFIVSNPPYVRYLEKALMKDNVLAYEPHLALFVEDNDPLLFYRKIAGLGLKILKSGGHLYFEINEAYGAETKEMLESLAYEAVQVKKDLQGKDRMIKAVKK